MISIVSIVSEEFENCIIAYYSSIILDSLNKDMR